MILTMNYIMISNNRLFLLLFLLTALVTGCLDTPESDFDREVREADEAIQLFLEANGIEAERHSSGVYIEVLEENESGRQIVRDHVVGVVYEMYHLEGDYLVDSHEDRSDPLYFSYSYDHGYNAILPAGLNYSINTMRLGEKFRFYIPSYQAYSGYSNEDFFDEYSHFIMDVEVVDLKTEEEIRELELQQVKAYAEAHEYDAHSFPNGLYHITIEEGEGDTPQSNSRVELTFTRKYLDGTPIESDTVNVYMNERPFVPGFENGVLLMKEGETAELVMPSSQAFGKSVQVLPQGMRKDIFEVTTHIPLTKPFSPVVYEVELLNVQ